MTKTCQPSKVLDKYMAECKVYRGKRPQSSLQVTFHCRQLLRNLFLYLQKNITSPQKKASLPKFRFFAHLVSALGLKEIQIQSWGYALYSILVDEQFLPASKREHDQACKKAPVDFDSIEDIVLKFAVITAVQHEL